MSGPDLVVSGVGKTFGAVRALHGVDWALRAGTIGGVVGPNGSGKTTLFNCLSGYFPVTAGQVVWQGTDVTTWSMRRRAHHGLVRTFQSADVFDSLTTRQNVEFASWRARSRQQRSVDDLLELGGLAQLAKHTAGTLSYGDKRLLGITLALAISPTAILLDEPSSGLSEMETDSLKTRLAGVRDAGIAVGLIDHHMDFLLPLCDDVMLLRSGQLAWSGVPGDFLTSPVVAEAYLGSSAVSGTDNVDIDAAETSPA